MKQESEDLRGDDPRRIVDEAEAARLLGISEAELRVRRLTEDACPAWHAVAESAPRYRVADLEAWRRSSTKRAPAYLTEAQTSELLGLHHDRLRHRRREAERSGDYSILPRYERTESAGGRTAYRYRREDVVRWLEEHPPLDGEGVLLPEDLAVELAVSVRQLRSMRSRRRELEAAGRHEEAALASPPWVHWSRWLGYRRADVDAWLELTRRTGRP